MTVANVKLWGRTIGAVSWDDDRQLAHFEYAPAFIDSGIEVSPLMMPLAEQIYSFPALPRDTFHGLPGLLADSLPDRFGNALIDSWLSREGRDPASFNPVERLCYTGTRGMGALEFTPAIGPSPKHSKTIDVHSLVNLASVILTQRSHMEGSFSTPERAAALQDILRVGTSAGGARAKAVIAWNPDTNTVRSGQVDTGEGFSYWLLKFDGVSGNRDKEQEDPGGYGLIEYAYYLMARAAGIEMSDCRLFQERGRSHFMARRFDRTDTGQKLHMQSLCALCHYDFNQPGAYSYEQTLQTMRLLGLPMSQIEEQYRRMAFNIIARNQDDHVKNIAFLMDKSGNWSLSPAYDMTYSYNPTGHWTSSHQMTLNGKRDDFQLDDFVACEKHAAMKRGRGIEILKQVRAAVLMWKKFAEAAGVPAGIDDKIAATHSTEFHPD